MKLALCNEVIAENDFRTQCEMAAALGYDGLEVAPFTLGPDPHLLSPSQRAELRRIASDAGIGITGLHWLLVTPKGLSINCADQAVRQRTQEVMKRLIGLCGDLGGSVLVHGSPQQRSIADGENPLEVRRRAVKTFQAIGKTADEAGIIYCIEPLARNETNFINTVAEAADLVAEINCAAVRTMIDTSASGQTEEMSVAELIEKWLPTGVIAHIQLNDTNRRGPGQGDDQFEPILKALVKHKYNGVMAVEPFKYIPDGPTTAARSIGYIKGIMEALS